MWKRIFLVCEREYLSRVRKRSFILMTILTPLLIIGFYGIIIYININREIGEEEKMILVADATMHFESKFQNKPLIVFTPIGFDSDNDFEVLTNTNAYALLRIKQLSDGSFQYKLIGKDQPSLSVLTSVSEQIERILKTDKLKSYGIEHDILNEINATKVTVQTAKVTSKGEEDTEIITPVALALVSSLLIYFFIFMYGVQVMRGVIEEKSNRIVEVIISSVKPFELMMGKIIGIVMVGFTQLLIWVLLVFLLGSMLSGFMITQLQPEMAEVSIQSKGIMKLSTGLENYNFTPIIIGFLFYFITGYIFYAALFAAVGAAVDNETETQQFVLPITMPLVITLVLTQTFITNSPNGTLAVWLSMIPFTSPIVMISRIAFGVEWWQVLLSMASMVAGIFLVVWIAARIYRVGILMYGKKPTYKELAKWLFYKQ
jgi:ABC-2 type transport system permease protein